MAKTMCFGTFFKPVYGKCRHEQGGGEQITKTGSHIPLSKMIGMVARYERESDSAYDFVEEQIIDVDGRKASSRMLKSQPDGLNGIPSKRYDKVDDAKNYRMAKELAKNAQNDLKSARKKKEDKKDGQSDKMAPAAIVRDNDSAAADQGNGNKI